MSLISHSSIPRSMFDMDKWIQPFGHGTNTLELFDPFDQLDHMMSRNLQWLQRPDFGFPMLPLVPQKYRVVVDCAGFDPKSITTNVNNNKLVVSAHEEVKHDSDNFSVKEFKKTYELPPHSESDKLVSFMTPDGNLVLEVPLKETHAHPNADLFPRIVDVPNGKKEVQLSVAVPENIDPSKVHVSIKDRDLIVKAEDKKERPDGKSRFYYYKRTTLPENTDFKELKCNMDGGRLSVTAPLNPELVSHRKVPIEHKKHPEIAHK